MIIDFHCHIGKDEGGETFSLEELKKSMNKWNIDKTVVFPFNCSDSELIEESLKILEKSKQENWIIPFLRFHPETISKEELNNLINKGFKGIKLHPASQEFDANDPDFYWIYELCQEKNIPILFHSLAIDVKFSHPSKIIKIAKLFPNLKIIIAHFFGNDVTKTMKIAKNHKNIYSDISVFSRTLRINQAVYEYGFKNLLFGSDAPYDSQGIGLLKIKESNLKEEDKELILYKNAKKILNLS